MLTLYWIQDRFLDGAQPDLPPVDTIQPNLHLRSFVTNWSEMMVTVLSPEQAGIMSKDLTYVERCSIISAAIDKTSFNTEWTGEFLLGL